jgi:FixJ family two-component response regulator
MEALLGLRDWIGQLVVVISIIDDDASVRAATHRLVRSLGYVAHTFASATTFCDHPN